MLSCLDESWLKLPHIFSPANFIQPAFCNARVFVANIKRKCHKQMCNKKKVGAQKRWKKPKEVTLGFQAALHFRFAKTKTKQKNTQAVINTMMVVGSTLGSPTKKKNLQKTKNSHFFSVFFFAKTKHTTTSNRQFRIREALPAEN